MTLLEILIRIRVRQLAEMRGRMAIALASSALVIIGIGSYFYQPMMAAVRQTDSSLYAASASSLLASVLVFWVTLRMFGFGTLGWEFDLVPPFRTPLSPPSVFGVRTICNLLGVWLVTVLPVLLFCAQARHPSPAGFVMSALAILLFAIQANALSSIIYYLVGRELSGIFRPLIVVLASLALSVTVFGTLRAATMHDNGTLTNIGRTLHRLHFAWLSLIPTVHQTAQTFVSIRRNDWLDAGLHLVLQAAFLALLLAVEYALVVREYFVRSSGPGPTRYSSSWFTGALNSRFLEIAQRTNAVLFLKELRSVARLPGAVALTVLFICYCSAFVVFIPPGSVVALELILLLPFMVFTGCKSNVLGPDAASVRGLYVLPIDFDELMILKTRLVDLLVLIVALLSIGVGVACGTIRLRMIDYIMLFTYMTTQFCVWDMVGSVVSLLFPKPVIHGRAPGTDGTLGVVALFLAPLCTSIVFMLLEIAGLRSGHIRIAACMCVAAMVVTLLAYRILFRPRFADMASGRREEIYHVLQAGLAQ